MYSFTHIFYNKCIFLLIVKLPFISSLLPLLVAVSIFSGIFSACSATEPVRDDTDSNLQDLSHLEEIYWQRINEARMNFTRADVDFMYGMIPHHAQALIMSRLAPENGANRLIETLAARIINAQGDEIALMKRWLEDRGQPVPEIHIHGLEIMIHGMDDQHGNGHGDHGHHGMHDHSDMPGMLTQAQLEELAGAKGPEFDRLFLEFMIEHHKGAVIMVDDLFAVDGAAADREMFDLASGIHAEQVTEIERMKWMLEEMD